MASKHFHYVVVSLRIERLLYFVFKDFHSIFAEEEEEISLLLGNASKRWIMWHILTTITPAAKNLIHSVIFEKIKKG